MPATRKSGRLSGGAGRQSTLSFNHRVTKSVPKPVKDVKSSTVSTEYISEPEPPKSKTEDVVPTATEPEEPKVQKSEAELKAEKISAAAIERYWSKIDAARTAKAVHKKHTEGLSTGEKVLRYFDVSSQYGVCALFFLSPPLLYGWNLLTASL